MTKPVFDDEFKQGVVDYANQHPEESKVSIAKSSGIADSTIHKWIKDANNNDNKLNLEDLVIFLVMRLKKLQD